MFNSATFFRIASDFVLPPMDALEEALQAARFVPCGATQTISVGWVAPRKRKSTVLAETVGQQVILSLCTERRVVPASAVRDAVDEKVEGYKAQTGCERVGAKMKKEFKEDALLGLLPRAFPKRSNTTLWLDPVNKFLVIDSASSSGADQIVSYLVEALSRASQACTGLLVKPVLTEMSAGAAMAHWLGSREAPSDFTVDRACELKMPDDQKSTVRYSRHTLEIDEVAGHIASGKRPTQLELTWRGRVSFTLMDTAQIKKIKLLDVVLDAVKENAHTDDAFDADAAIVIGELSLLIPDLLYALGGEVDTDTGAAGAAGAVTVTVTVAK